ncbi:hypothetical protein E2562_021643 [Oryza meyeriana var. granulata]|uniref:Uncharacterized protein n=1 Tax=Oryza meyeriana var. granulata TaxID=110450 RepID=A0A6G1DZQ9_9ORYZ|nr:hypothetical protein E2562_021643 [Oryza meyeriana var. granulata]
MARLRRGDGPVVDDADGDYLAMGKRSCVPGHTTTAKMSKGRTGRTTRCSPAAEMGAGTCNDDCPATTVLDSNGGLAGDGAVPAQVDAHEAGSDAAEHAATSW